ncbi:phenylacetate--CoA ligase family protein [Rarobacter faecitabidus]|uniref:Phenylacetate-CoA ligase n=1 Tax=Rarobacter faecitabidus TaxID=13243 RepID=A0A542ZAK6_RARFA|nr:CoF synthetase [Rarobacter faecitabidus]TQL57377.1 phenylacetate-CoA ligase [Rarobacter faecitabidus]
MKPLIYAFVWAQDIVVKSLTYSVYTHKFLLAPGIEPLRWRLGRWRAFRTFELTARKSPAYADFLRRRGITGRLPFFTGRDEAFAAIPEMDKDNYIRAYSIPDRCLGGKLPRRGVVVDESSGSSGTPTSWVRGSAERRATRQLLQVGFARTAKRLTKQPFVINAFSLGAWATGMNVSASLTDMTLIKSCGPDRDKIIATMKEFGPNFTYIITSYPPFLKGLLEDTRLDWAEYDVVCAFGGEGISESMRDRIMESANAVFGSYGASDLEINISIETEFTIALRRAIASDPALAAELTLMDEYGVLPSIFQFNPFDYLIETNDAGEIVVTITRKENINPRIRYNIHDRGHVARMRDVVPVLRKYGHQEVIAEKFLDLPILFHYGRSDLSVDYNGAVVPPDALRDVINGDAELLPAVENHRLVSYEDYAGNRQLHIALQLSPGGVVVDESSAAARVFAALRAENGDFNNAIKTSAPGTEPTLAFYAFRTGVFAEDGAKLKNEYVWHLDAAEAAEVGMRAGVTASRDFQRPTS